MFDDEQRLKEVAQWAEKADNDLRTAVHTLTLRPGCPTDTVCFHAQQVAEKYLKGMLVWRGIAFPKWHDITALLKLLPAPDRPDLTTDECERLTAYATTLRYPGDYAPITLAEARRAVSIARRVRQQIRAHLPQTALRSAK